MEQVRTLPDFAELISPLASSTRKCLRKAGSPMANGVANSFTVAVWQSTNLVMTARLVGSASAWNTRSSSTPKFTIRQTMRDSFPSGKLLLRSVDQHRLTARWIWRSAHTVAARRHHLAALQDASGTPGLLVWREV